VIVIHVDGFSHRRGGKAAHQRGQERSELGHGALCSLGLVFDAI
jgi:hypothetical protein